MIRLDCVSVPPNHLYRLVLSPAEALDLLKNLTSQLVDGPRSKARRTYTTENGDCVDVLILDHLALRDATTYIDQERRRVEKEKMEDLESDADQEFSHKGVWRAQNG